MTPNSFKRIKEEVIEGKYQADYISTAESIVHGGLEARNYARMAASKPCLKRASWLEL